jgi:hypothetical protein
MEYNITNKLAHTSLPEEYQTVDHISQFFLTNSGEREPLTGYITEHSLICHIPRSANTEVITFDINKTKVWCKLAEFKFWQAVLDLRPVAVSLVYTNGTTSPLPNQPRTRCMGSGIDGYKLEIKFKLNYQ